MTEPFSVNVDHGPGRVTITVSGEIDLAAVAPLEAARAEALASAPDELLVDLAGVSFIDSSGLKFLLETHRMTERTGCALSLVRPAETAMHVFRLTGTDLRLPFVAGDPPPGA